MLERWTAVCRALVPARRRATAFDPAVDDLRAEWIESGRAERPRPARAAALVHLAGRILGTAVQCWRLPPAAGPLAASPGRAGQRIAIWRHDVTQSVRLLVRQPGFSAAAVLTLALGIGANLAVFSFVNTLLLSPVPVPDPAGLVRVHGTNADTRSDTVSFPDYSDARLSVASSLDLAAHAQPVARVAIGEAAENRIVELVSGNYFRVLGVPALIGRLFDDRDDAPEGAHPVVVISERFWRTRLGGRPDVIGQALVINATSFQIAGVAAPPFRGTFSAYAVDVWAPLSMQQQVRPRGLTLARRGWGWLSMIGRVRPGTPLPQVQGEMDAAAAGIRQQSPGASRDLGFAVTKASALADGERRSLTPFLVLVFGFTVLLLVVTCANLAGVMQARLITRTRELAIRQSLGASRARLAIAWLTEALVLSTAGAAAGVLVSRLITYLTARVTLPTQLLAGISFETSLDARVWAYAFGVAVAASLMFGLLPSLGAGRNAPLEILKDDGGSIVTGRRSLRLRRVVVFVQVAVSVVLLAAAGLLAAGLVREHGLDPGYRTASLGLMSFSLEGQGIAPGARPEAARRLFDHVRATPGVVRADLAAYVPLSIGRDRMRFRIPGYRQPDGSDNLSLEFNTVGADYFATLGIPFVAGAGWTPERVSAAELPIVITQAMANAYWQNGHALGELVELVGTGMLRVVGIVRDSAYHQIGEAPLPVVFLPAERQVPGTFTVLMRTAGDPGPILKQLERTVPALDSRFVPFDPMTFDELRGVPLLPARVLLIAAAAFGLLALVLTGIGLYGVVATSVAQRTREIGLRMALGARPGEVLRGILREAGLVVGVGAVAGVGGSYLLAGFLRSWLARVTPFDPLVALAVALLLGGFAVVAAWAPARRASRIDPIVALRQ